MYEMLSPVCPACDRECRSFDPETREAKCEVHGWVSPIDAIDAPGREVDSDQTLKETRPDDGFRYFAASEFHNLPALYLSGSMFLVVVSRDVRRRFTLDRIEDAVACYLSVIDKATD